jgi:hypothetical protein
MKILKITFLVFFYVLFNQLIAQDTCECKRDWAKPRSISFQYAGGIGNYVVGPGYNLNKSGSLQLAVLYGFTPKYKANTSIHTLSIKFDVSPYQYTFGKNNISPTAGIGLSQVFGDGSKTFFRLPEVYPDGYYAPSSIRFHFNFGGRYKRNFEQWGFVKALEFYIETTTNDLYLKYYFSYTPIHFRQIFSMALGLKVYIK